MNLNSSLPNGRMLLFIAPALTLLILIVTYIQVGGGMNLPGGMRVTLPQSASSLKPSDDPETVTMTLGRGDGGFGLYFNRRELTLADLPDALKASASKSKLVILNADANLSLGQVVRVQNMILSLNWDVALATNFPKETTDVTPVPEAKE